VGLVSLYVATSLDGKLAGPNDELDWLPEPSAEEDYGYAEYLGTVRALVMGSRTYEVARRLGPWPYTKPAFVFSRREIQVSEPGVTVVHEDPVAFVRRLAGEVDGRVWVVGGGRLAAPLLSAGVIEEVVLTLIPVVLGPGIGLFDDVRRRLVFELEVTRSWPSGVVQATYRVAG
jgi:dihydrofolate reductase